MKDFSLRWKKEIPAELTAFDPFLARLLAGRGLVSTEEAQKFISPDYEKGIHDPFLLPDMKKAVARIEKAISDNEKIAIYSDYDADGIPGGALLGDFFHRIGYENIIHYIPHRHEEGYGLHKEAIDTLKGKNVNLIITVDLGIMDVEQVLHAKNLGIDTVITDHHEPGEKIPDAIAVVNPKRKDSEYPDRMLCGSAVAYKLVQAILSENRHGLKEGAEKWLLDLVGIATLSDMVPLVGENRIFAYYGLAVLRKSPRLGLVRLFRSLKINQKKLNEDDIAFMITPRINAASRMGNPEDALFLLTATTESEADLRLNHLNLINEERKGVVASMILEMKRMLKKRDTKDVLVMGNPKWRPSLLGLAANSLAEEYGRPVFLWGREPAGIKGSCRSNGSVNLVELMSSVKDSFDRFGGHSQAGGFALKEDSVFTFDEVLNKAFVDLACEHVKKEKEIDDVISVKHVSPQTWKFIEKLAPFGIGNPKPVFLLENVAVENVRIFGKTGTHAEVELRDADGSKTKAIKFFANKGEYESLSGKISMLAHLEPDPFRGPTAVRLRVDSIV